MSAFNIKNHSYGTYADNQLKTHHLITFNLNKQPSGALNQQWHITLSNKPSTGPLYQISSADGQYKYVNVDSTGKQLVLTTSQENPRLFELLSRKWGASFNDYVIRDAESGLVWTLSSGTMRTRITLSHFDNASNQTWSIIPV